jgi:hypothetical protein
LFDLLIITKANIIDKKYRASSSIIDITFYIKVLIQIAYNEHCKRSSRSEFAEAAFSKYLVRR